MDHLAELFLEPAASPAAPNAYESGRSLAFSIVKWPHQIKPQTCVRSRTMSHDETKYSLKPTARKMLAVAFALCINALLFSLVGAVFALDSTIPGSSVLS